MTTSLMIYQGLLIKELVQLKVEDVNLEEGTVYISGSPNSNERTLQLKSSQVMLIHRYVLQVRPKLIRRSSDHLLVNLRGKPITSLDINYMLKSKKYLFPDRKLSPSTIKMSLISNLLKQGHDLRETQYFGGYRKVSTVEKYRQLQVEELKEVILRMHPY